MYNMPRTFNLQDPDDLIRLRYALEEYSLKDWQVYLEFMAHPDNKRLFRNWFEDRGCLMQMERSAGNIRNIPPARMVRAVSIADKIDQYKEHEAASEATENQVKKTPNDVPRRHVTFRVAWHDNRWNGTICNDPKRNRFCSGYHSLLSERLRKRKAQHIDQEVAYRGQPITSNYVPPCFWSVNLFGERPITVKHDNPAERRLNPISELLPEHAMFSWPFSVSFTRTQQQVQTDGAYPHNLETVRIPRFQAKIRNRQSIAFIYAKFSNPLTEEEQQYLVIGCGIVSEQGDSTKFGPRSIIDEKRTKHRYRNFPEMNWALRFSFDPDQLVRMPYHEYLDHVSQLGFDEDRRDEYLSRIKVAIHEPELQHCFKYVAMDVDDDEAIYLLSKMRQKLDNCRNDGIVHPDEMQQKLDQVDFLLSSCWNQRGYIPGFTTLSRALLNWTTTAPLPLEKFLSDLCANEPDYVEKLTELLENPNSDTTYREYKSILRDLREAYEDNHGLSTEEFLHLCLLNLKPQQFKRVLDGKLKIPERWNRSLDELPSTTELNRISNNPYLLFEEYNTLENTLDPVTGEETDGPIDLFKIDRAYFPDIRTGLQRIDLQREMRPTDKRRLRAIVMRYLRTLETSGHCFADGAELEEAVKAYPLFYHFGQEYNIPPNTFIRLKNDYANHFQENSAKLTVIAENDTHYFYLNSVYQAERKVEGTIKRLLQTDLNNDKYFSLDKYLDDSCNKLRERLGNNFDEQLFRGERIHLYDGIYRSRFFVLSGNAGSGKSYELLNILKNLENQGQTYLLLAPTGKATLRLKSDDAHPGIEASTIDKLLAEADNNLQRRNQIRNINNLIIDEMSMVDLLKFHRLLSLFEVSRPSFKRLILVGDPNQLPPIGYGKVLKDIMYYLKTSRDYDSNYIELQTNCRNQLAKSRILEFSEGFIPDGEIPEDLTSLIASGQTSISEGFRVRFWQAEDELYKLLDAEFDQLCARTRIAGSREERLNQVFGLKSDGTFTHFDKIDLDFLQVLSPYNSDYWGTIQLNDYIQDKYKSERELELMENRFKHLDKIIRTKNYYDNNQLVLSNGSIGMIRKEREGELLYFPELTDPKPVRGANGIRKNEREDFELAYAITVHKSQGSGFNHVFCILPRKLGLLSKELVYTALTRSKESITLLIQGSPNDPSAKRVLDKAQSRSFTESRRTTLLLPKPFKFYALEADGKFIESRVELLIYQALKEMQNQLGKEEFIFDYEVKPFANNAEVPIKTDFTVHYQSAVWYWEHLGRLGNKRYEQTWQEVKKPTYKKAGLYNQLITTDERTGINPETIKKIINYIIEGNITTEDVTNHYSLHHFHLR